MLCGTILAAAVALATFASFAAKKQFEVAEPGYCAVTLEGGVKCEATATERVAVRSYRTRGPKHQLVKVKVAALCCFV